MAIEVSPRVRKIPERQCIGCSAHRPKSELIRIVRDPNGEISLDATGKKPGRGAYICKASACLAKAKKSRRLEKNLSVRIPDEVYERLERELDCDER